MFCCCIASELSATKDESAQIYRSLLFTGHKIGTQADKFGSVSAFSSYIQSCSSPRCYSFHYHEQGIQQRLIFP